jgi:hypothetical protein
MKLTERKLSVGVTKKINIGNYESLQLHAGLSANIPDGEDPEIAYEEMWEQCLIEVDTLEEELVGGDEPRKSKK